MGLEMARNTRTAMVQDSVCGHGKSRYSKRRNPAMAEIEIEIEIEIEELIRERAYQIWLDDGKPQGCEQEH